MALEDEQVAGERIATQVVATHTDTSGGTDPSCTPAVASRPARTALSIWLPSTARQPQAYGPHIVRAARKAADFQRPSGIACCLVGIRPIIGA